VDETGKPVPQARAWLYLKAGPWEHEDLLIRKITTGPDGVFVFRKPPNLRRSGTTSENCGYVILADHPKYAVGWRNIAVNKQDFEGDIVLTPAVTRSLTVTDEKGKPMPGAVVNACLLGDAHSPGSQFPDVLILRVDEGPLAAVTDSQGRAALDHLPRTEAAFSATASGFAPGYTATYAPRSPGVIRLTRSSSLSGTVRDETGKPIGGITAVLVAEPIVYLERAKTNSAGQYRFEGLRARGWSEWPGGAEFRGNFTITIESPDFAARSIPVLMEPGDETNSFDITVVPASRLNVEVVGKDTGKPLADILITGSSPAGNFAASTKGDGMASFSIIPGKFQVSISEVPEGHYVEGSLRSYPETSSEGIARGPEVKVRLTMPSIPGRLIAVSGFCRLPGGKNATDAAVYASAGNFDYEGPHHGNLVRPAQADSKGRFLLKAVPSGRRLALYAESKDGQFAGATTIQTHAEDNPATEPVIVLQPTVKVSRILKSADGFTLASKTVEIEAVVGDRRVHLYRREEKSDSQGRIELSRIIPGLKYHLVEVIDLDPRGGVPPAPGNKYDETIELAP